MARLVPNVTMHLDGDSTGWRGLARVPCSSMAAEREDALVRGLLTGIAAFRWLAWGWMAIVLVVSRDELEGGRPWLAVLLVGAALVITAVTGFVARTDPDRLLAPPIIVAELAIGFALGAGDDWSFAGDHPQSLGSVWPLAGVLTAGVRWGGRGGATAGAVVGLGRLFGDLVEVRSTEPISELTVTAASTSCCTRSPAASRATPS